MTEDEAKTKWCPFARSRTIKYDLSNNRKACTSYMKHGHDTPTTTCIGSACMAWRYEHPEPASAGYCGLAGKP